MNLVQISNLFNDLGIQPEWDLENWNEDSVALRTEFYFRYLKYLIQSSSN
jgi:poly(3-hydroxyalkanoate) synthetase